MAHIAGFGRDQLLSLSEAVDDYVEADNSVRFIDVFVGGLDLAAAGFGRVEAKATGRPGYAPGDLLKLYIYGTSIGSDRADGWSASVAATSRSSGCLAP
jgi:transposase